MIKKSIFLIVATIFITQNLFGATIDLKWLDGTTTINTNQCTFGNNTINIPTNAPKKPGYKFTGWKLMPECNLTNLVDVKSIADYSHKLNDQECSGRTYTADNKAVWHSFLDCSQDERVKDLGVGEWKAIFSFGTVYGEATCNNIANTKNPMWVDGKYMYYVENTRPANTFTKEVTGPRCWCRVTGMVGNDGSRCNAATAAWVYRDNWGGYTNPNESCAKDCTDFCQGSFMNDNVHAAAVAFLKTFDMSKYNTEIKLANTSTYKGFKEINGSGNSNTSKYGLSSNGQWAMEFSYGTVYGEASCNNTNGYNNSQFPFENNKFVLYNGNTKSGSTFTRGQNTGENCWCRMTGFTPKGGTKSNVVSTPWVFRFKETGSNKCKDYCAQYCPVYFGGDYPEARKALYMYYE